MALDTFNRIANQVRMRCPTADILLAQDWVNHAFREIAERRPWSWLLKFGQFISPDKYSTGTVSITNNSFTVTGTGTNWTANLVGMQFRVGLAAPIYTVAAVNSPTSLSLDAPFGFASVTNVGYIIYQCYFTVPRDFLTFQTVYDPRLNWQLHLNSTQAEINQWDSQRANVGLGYAVVSRDYTTVYTGSVGNVAQISGTGTIPVFTGVYTGPVDSVITVQIIGGGASGVATFQWKQNSAAFSPTLTSSAFATGLTQGVQVYFPAGTYNANDIFVVACKAQPQVGLPRFEIWPHFQSAYNWVFMYVSRAVDLEDPGATLPYTIRGDVLLNMALAEAANWPGPSEEKRNIYYNPVIAARLAAKCEHQIMELERQDDELMEQDVMYSAYLGLPFSPFPFADSAWLQSHEAPSFSGI